MMQGTLAALNINDASSAKSEWCAPARPPVRTFQSRTAVGQLSVVLDSRQAEISYFDLEPRADK